MLLCATLWMLWAVASWFVCVLVLDRDLKKALRTAVMPQLAQDVRSHGD